MDSWLVLGLIAALFYGISAVATKMATSNSFFGIPPAMTAFLSLIGFFVAIVSYVFYTGGFDFSHNPTGMGIAIGSGLLAAIAMIFTFIALNQGADLARLNPVYNTNTLIAVFIGIFFLGEIPDFNSALRVISGAILIVVGLFLVAG